MKQIDVTVRELRPELVDDYLRFFDEVYHIDPWLNRRVGHGFRQRLAHLFVCACDPPRGSNTECNSC